MAIWQNDEVLSLLIYLVLHISLGSFGSRGIKIYGWRCVFVCEKGGGGGGGGGELLPSGSLCLSEADVESPSVNGG